VTIRFWYQTDIFSAMLSFLYKRVTHSRFHFTCIDSWGRRQCATIWNKGFSICVRPLRKRTPHWFESSAV